MPSPGYHIEESLVYRKYTDLDTFLLSLAHLHAPSSLPSPADDRKSMICLDLLFIISYRHSVIISKSSIVFFFQEKRD